MNENNNSNTNFYRPQIYFQRKEEIEALEEGFKKSKERSKSSYLHSLVLEGLGSLKKKENDEEEEIRIIHLIGDALANECALQRDFRNDTEKRFDTLTRHILSCKEEIRSLQERTQKMEKREDILLKAISNIYAFTEPGFGIKKAKAESGEYNSLPQRFYE